MSTTTDCAPPEDQAMILTAGQIAGLEIGFEEVIETVTQVFLQQWRGELITVPRTVLGPQEAGRFMAFPGALPAVGVSGVKWLATGHLEPGGAPQPFCAHIILSDMTTGRLRAILDARWITLARTVAVTAIAALRAAKPDSSVIAFFGCGEQSSMHLSQLVKLFPLKKVLVVGRSPDGIARFLALAASLGLEADPADARTCLGSADIVVSATSAQGRTERFADAAWAKPGSFVSLVDLGRVWQGHADDGALIADDRDQLEALRADGRITLSGEPLELNALVATDEQSWAGDRPCVFIPTGYGVADLAIADRLVRMARRQGAGRLFPLD